MAENSNSASWNTKELVERGVRREREIERLEKVLEGKEAELERHVANAATTNKFTINHVDEVYGIRLLLEKSPEWRGKIEVQTGTRRKDDQFKEMLVEIVEAAGKGDDVEIV